MKFLVLLLVVVNALAQSNPAVRKQQFNLDNGLAIQGYDPVAYFIQNKAVKGAASNSFTYKNVIYRFASAANLKAFQESAVWWLVCLCYGSRR